MKSKFLILLGLTASLFVACNKYQGNESNGSYDSSTDTDPKIKELTKFLSKDMRINLSKFKYDDQKNTFIIDGDALISLEDAEIRFQNKNKQQFGTYKVNSTVAPAITIYVPGTVPAVWQSAIGDAITNWNSTDCLIKFQLTTNSSTAKIIVSTTYNTTSIIATAALPTFGGNPGSTVEINTYYNTSLSALQKVFAITHELGHTIGFHHTDQTTGTTVSETPTSDANSIMNSTVLSWAGFTPYDIIAFGVQYPNYPGSSKFLRYYKSGNPDHYYTTGSTDLGAGSGGYVFENPGTGYIFKTNVSGTVPLYRWYRSSPGQHFYTVSSVSIPGYTYEGIAGYVYTTQVSGTRPLYRYFRSSAGDHFYTVNYSELGSGASGYVLEGIECYVY